MIYAKVKTDTLKKAGLAFDQSRVSTKCPQEENGVKLSTWELVTPRGIEPRFPAWEAGNNPLKSFDLYISYKDFDNV